MEYFQRLFDDTIRELYSAERQFLTAMPKLMRGAQSPKLKALIETHVAQSERHVRRLEEVAKMGGILPVGKAASGLAAGKAGSALEDAIIACDRKKEHYEVCSYGTVAAWAEALGNMDAANLLQESLDEEVQIDELLCEISKVVHTSAVAASTSRAPRSGSRRGTKLAPKVASAARSD